MIIGFFMDDRSYCVKNINYPQVEKITWILGNTLEITHKKTFTVELSKFPSPQYVYYTLYNASIKFFAILTPHADII